MEAKKICWTDSLVARLDDFLDGMAIERNFSTAFMSGWTITQELISLSDLSSSSEGAGEVFFERCCLEWVEV